MSHPDPSHDPENKYPSDHYKPSGKMKKMAKKAGQLGKLKGLMETKHFGAQRRARHKSSQKMRGKEHPF